MAEQTQQQTQEKTGQAPPPRHNEAGVGALLKASRLRVGEDLRDIADILRIRYVYMEAIEDGRYDALPGPTYAAGFIRAYAEHLGLDSEEVVRRFKAEGVPGRETTDLVFPEPIPESGIPGGAVILVGIVVAVVAYGAWYINTSKDGFLSELVSPLPDRLAHLADGETKAKSQPPPAAKPEIKPEAKPEAVAAAAPQPQPQPAPTPEAKPQPTPEATTPPTSTPAPQPKPEAKPATPPQPTTEPTTARAPGRDAGPAPSPAPTTTAATEPTAAAPGPAAAPPPEPTPAATAVPETRETPVATARPAEPPAPVEPSIAPANVPVDMIPPPRPAAPAAATASATPTATSEPAAATPTATPTPETTTTATATPTPEAAQPAPAAATTGAATSGEEATRILVRAKMNSWIQVRDDNANELLVTRLLRSGDSYAVPNRAGLRLSTGNAGALEILVDGDLVPSIGDDGAVRRNVLLDAEKLKAGQAVNE